MLIHSLNTNSAGLTFFKNVNKTFLRFLSTSGVSSVKLAFATYENSSSDKEAPLVITHGLFGSKQNWTSLCKAYSQRISPPRKVIALDLRNHGESVHSDEHTYAHLVEDVRQFLIDYNIEKITLMGHSMGGRCAMLFALTYPAFLEKLIVVDISPISLNPSLNGMPEILRLMNRIKMPNNISLSQARSIVDKQLAEQISDKNLRAFILTNLVTSGAQSFKWRVNIPTLIKDLGEVTKFPAVNGVQYTGDTLFIGGANSGFIPKLGPKPFTLKDIAKNVRFKTDLAQTKNYKSIVDLAYASYQSTDAIFGKVLPQEIPTPLVILHGILGSKSNFNTLCKRYHEGSKPKRLVYAVDLRNHGDSVHSKDNTYDDLIMDVLKFVQQMELKKISLIGHDVGGRVGMLLCLKYPEIVEKLIVHDVSPVTTSHSFKVFPEILRTLNSLVFPPNLSLQQAKAHVASCLSRIVKNKVIMSLVLMNLMQKSDGRYFWRFNGKALLEHFEELSSFPDIFNAHYHGPVLFVGGAKSDYIQKSDFPNILKLFPNAELKYIEGAGHWVHAEKPNEFLKMTMDFLNKKPL